MASTTPPSNRGERRIRGLAVSPGVAFGPLVWKDRRFERPRTWPLEEGQVQSELQRFREAVGKTRDQIIAIQRQLVASGVEGGEAHIFDAHLLVLEDPTVLEEIEKTLQGDRLNVESVFHKVMNRYLQAVRQIDDPYLRERAIDVEDVALRVMQNLQENEGSSLSETTNHVVYSQDLGPSDTVHMDRERLLGFATELGSFTSHTAIMARSLNIPGVVGLDVPTDLLRHGGDVILDGYNGMLIFAPDPSTIDEYKELRESKRVMTDRLRELRDSKAITADGREITMSGNIEFGHEVEILKENGAEGIGLYRTEFFYFAQDKHPGEDQQAEVYARVAKAVHPHGVIIRTLDVGGDKFFSGTARHAEPNPFLGWRGIRISLSEPEIFKKQLRAILRSSAEAKVRLMYPLISGVEEVRAANAILKICKDELAAEGVAFDENLETGCIIELPSAALMADQLAKEVDFFSVGTNDLIQYTIAVDRVNERVAHLYQPGHPAILRLLRMVVDAAHANGIWAGVCGEMAGDPLFTPLFVGLGYDELSMGASQLLRVKRAVQQLNAGECEVMTDELLQLDTPAAVTERCRQMATAKYGELL